MDHAQILDEALPAEQPGDMAGRIRFFDWAATPLGPSAFWPSSLSTLLGLILESRQPMFIVWGASRIWLYNDAFIPLLAHRHPAALGRSAFEALADVPEFAALFDRVFDGEAIQIDGIGLTVLRDGRPEEAHFAFSYTPVRDEIGGVAGLFGVGNETTAYVRALANFRISDSQHLFLLDLMQMHREIDDPAAIVQASAAAIGRYLHADLVSFFETRGAEVLDFAPPWTSGRLPPLTGAIGMSVLDPKFVAAGHRGETVAVADTADDPLTECSCLALARIAAVIAAPIVRDGRWRAGLCAAHAETRQWAPHEIALVREASDLTWDAVERARTEAALRENELQLRLATEAAEVGLWDVDTISDTLFWPPRVKAMFGISPDVPVSMADFFAGLHPEDFEATARAYAAACDPAIRALYDVEYRTIGKEDGLVRWVAAKGRGIFDESGRCVRVIGTAIDISKRKSIERELHEFNQTLERRVAERTAERDRVWRNSRDLLAIVDRQGRYRALNPAWTDVLGYDTDALIGRTFTDFVWPEDAPSAAEAYKNVGAGLQVPSDYDTRMRHKDGSFRWISWHSSSEGEDLFAYGRDITEAKAQARTLAEAEHALRQAQKMEAVGQLTGGIAHDFNNLLQGVVGSLDLIRRKHADAEKVRHWAEAGLKAAERGAKLTAQLLAFSRAQKLELRALDLSRLLSGMRELLERTLGPATRVVLELGTIKAGVIGDETQLELAVLNLAINARDAMPQGGELTIRTREHRALYDPELAPGYYIALSVSDTGFGMPADVRARAFDPFFTTKGIGKGTGLGLSQVYGMARQAGGTARIETPSGEGTTVTLYLRRANVSGSRLEESRDESVTAARPQARILVIDDDPDVRRFLQQSLESLGYASEEAENGADGLALLQHGPPDLLIVDYAMPGMTGAEVAAKARDLYPELPIVFATGYAETAAIEHVIDTHTVVLRKPFRVGELQRALAKLLKR